MSELAVPA